jgi:selenocysteine lyase/cysteine desulfurase
VISGIRSSFGFDEGWPSCLVTCLRQPCEKLVAGRPCSIRDNGEVAVAGSSSTAQSRATDWQAVRARYPAASAKAYLDTACKGIPPPEAVAAIEDFCRFVRESPLSSVTDETIVVLEHMRRARQAAARLVGAEEDEIALVESTQQGLYAAADLLSLAPGEHVLASDVEFFGTVLPWRDRLRLVPHRSGRTEVDDFAAAIDARTRAIVVSSVQEVTGALVDLPALSALCRERRLWLIVDGAQHVGPLPFDVRETPVDVLAVGGHKWLCCPFGLGFTYVRRDRLAERRATRPGYFALEPPAAGWSAYLEDPRRTPVDDLGLTRTARSLEPGGTGPYMAAAALAACLEALLELPQRFERVQELVGQLLDGLDRRGLHVVSPRDRRSGIVVFDVPDAHTLVDRLARSGVAVSLRHTTGIGGIRVSPYFYSDETDVARLLALLT